GVGYEVLNFAYPWDRVDDYSRHVLALGIYQLSVSDIERRVSDTTDPIGTLGATDAAYALSYAYSVSRSLGVGVTGKYITQSLDSYHGRAFGGDVGLLY